MVVSEESFRILAEHETWLPIDNLRRKQIRRKRIITLLLALPVLLGAAAIALLYGRDLWAQAASLQLDIVIAQWFTGIAESIASTLTARIAVACALLVLSGLLFWTGLRLRRRMNAASIDNWAGEVGLPDSNQVQLPEGGRLRSGGLNCRLKAILRRSRSRQKKNFSNNQAPPKP
jgi:hypothetical protein